MNNTDRTPHPAEPIPGERRRSINSNQRANYKVQEKGTMTPQERRAGDGDARYLGVGAETAALNRMFG